MNEPLSSLIMLYLCSNINIVELSLSLDSLVGLFIYLLQLKL